jgi:hypothetical protein
MNFADTEIRVGRDRQLRLIKTLNFHLRCYPQAHDAVKDLEEGIGRDEYVNKVGQYSDKLGDELGGDAIEQPLHRPGNTVKPVAVGPVGK